jgi:hypothetical protein
VEFIAIHLHLMGSNHANQRVVLEELVHRFASVYLRAFSFQVFGEADVNCIFATITWVGPQQIDKYLVFRNINKAVNLINRLKTLGQHSRRDAPMYSEDAIIHKCSDWETLESIHK